MTAKGLICYLCCSSSTFITEYSEYWMTMKNYSFVSDIMEHALSLQSSLVSIWIHIQHQHSRRHPSKRSRAMSSHTIKFISVLGKQFLLGNLHCEAHAQPVSYSQNMLPFRTELVAPKCYSQHPSSCSIQSIYSTSGGFKCRDLPIDQQWNRIQVHPAGAVSWGSRVLCSEVIPQTSAAGSNYARTTQSLAAFGWRNSQHKPFYSPLCARHKGQGDALIQPSFVIGCV